METEQGVDKAVDRAVDNAVDNSVQAVDDAARLQAQKKRSIWLALALFGFVVLIGLTSALQLKKNIQLNSNANLERETGQ